MMIAFSERISLDIRIAISKGTLYINRQIVNLSTCSNKIHTGTIAISTLNLTQAMGPYIVALFPGFRKVPLVRRCLILFIGITLCYVALSGVDTIIDVNPGGAALFSVIGVSRAVQGLCTGLLFVIVQVSQRVTSLFLITRIEVLPHFNPRSVGILEADF